jgi:hypothetical protein
VVLLGGLALYAALGSPTGSIVVVQLAVNAGLLLSVLVSIAIRKPFTLQYARGQVARENWNQARFIRTNYIITGAWAHPCGEHFHEPAVASRFESAGSTGV